MISAIRNPQSAKKQNLVLAKCKHNRKLFIQLSNANAFKCFGTSTCKGAISPIVTVSKRVKQHYPSLGFTLLEMMVVIGLIALITGWAVPGIKKAYEDFRIKETLSHIDTYISSSRSYYLIKSEFVEDATPDLLKPHAAIFFPKYYHTRTIYYNRYYMNVKPYRGTTYDIDGWVQSSTGRFMITLWADESAVDFWRTLLREKYPGWYTNISYGKGIQLGLPDVTPQYVTESGSFRNRYY